MENIKEKFEHFNFMDYRKLAIILSLSLCFLSIVFVGVRGLNWGLDFTGGTAVEVSYPQQVELGYVRDIIDNSKYVGSSVQYFGDERTILIRLNEKKSADTGTEVLELLQQDNRAVELRRTEFIGAQVGEELREKGGLGMLLAVGLVLVYVAFRFQLKYALGAIIALMHDVLIILGLFSLLQLEFDLGVLAAILAVIGYSLNDTIVVSDRIRENMSNTRTESITEVINISLRQVFGRTLITSLTTLFVLLCLCLLSGDSIRNFALALTMGVVVGTYSSIYVASNLLVLLKLQRISEVKEKYDVDAP